MRLAVVTNELESRGEDLSGLRFGLLPILRLIASGKLLPDIVVIYAGQPAAIKMIAEMPIAEQERVARKELIPELPSPVRKAKKEISRRPIKLSTDVDDVKTGSVDSTIDGIAASGNPKDVGEMAANLIRACSQPKTALRAMLISLFTQAQRTEQLYIHVNAVIDALTEKKWNPLDDLDEHVTAIKKYRELAND